MFLVNPFELLQILVCLPREHSSALRRRACSGFDFYLSCGRTVDFGGSGDSWNPVRPANFCVEPPATRLPCRSGLASSLRARTTTVAANATSASSTARTTLVSLVACLSRAKTTTMASAAANNAVLMRTANGSATWLRAAAEHGEAVVWEVARPCAHVISCCLI